MKRDQYILGIGGYTFDAAACLLCNGRIVAAIEEERLSRQKHHSGMPWKAIERCLAMGSIGLEEIDYISFCYDPRLRYRYRIPYRLSKMVRHPVWSWRILTHEIYFVENFKRELALLKSPKTKVITPGHHLCHAGSTFYPSGFEEAAILSVDQRGEWDTTCMFLGRGQTMQILDRIHYPHSLGIFYAAITHFLGFQPDCDEYKVMGLASYGKPRFLKAMRDIVTLAPQGRFRLNLKYFSYHLNRGFYKTPYWTKAFYDMAGPPRRKEEPIEEHHQDLAASAQRCLEEVILHMGEELYRRTKVKQLCIAGGVGMNAVANGKMLEQSPFANIYLPPVAADNGLALGGALTVRHHCLGHTRQSIPQRADWGTAYSDAAVEQALMISKLCYQKSACVEEDVARLIVDGSIVGWFQGRMEYGARALGFRSILADPTLPGMKDKINKYVKFREEFRPFAPAVLEEEAERYFEMRQPVPFMTMVVSVRKEFQKRLAAVTHVDGSARVQTVSKENNLLLWRLLHEIKQHQGIPIVLNTSFNVMGEPLVETPEQAIRTFASTGMDYLAIGSFLIAKADAFQKTASWSATQSLSESCV